jgi:hypothetical protein
MGLYKSTDHRPPVGHPGIPYTAHTVATSHDRESPCWKLNQLELVDGFTHKKHMSHLNESSLLKMVENGCIKYIIYKCLKMKHPAEMATLCYTPSIIDVEMDQQMWQVWILLRTWVCLKIGYPQIQWLNMMFPVKTVLWAVLPVFRPSYITPSIYTHPGFSSWR